MKSLSQGDIQDGMLFFYTQVLTVFPIAPAHHRPRLRKALPRKTSQGRAHPKDKRGPPSEKTLTQRLFLSEAAHTH